MDSVSSNVPLVNKIDVCFLAIEVRQSANTGIVRKYLSKCWSCLFGLYMTFCHHC